MCSEPEFTPLFLRHALRLYLISLSPPAAATGSRCCPSPQPTGSPGATRSSTPASFKSFDPMSDTGKASPLPSPCPSTSCRNVQIGFRASCSEKNRETGENLFLEVVLLSPRVWLWVNASHEDLRLTWGTCPSLGSFIIVTASDCLTDPARRARENLPPIGGWEPRCTEVKGRASCP